MTGPRVGRELDLDPGTRGALELDAVLAGIADLAASEPAARAIRTARPGCDLEILHREHEEVEEARAIHRTEGRLLPANLPDPEPALRGLALPGYAVEPLALRDLGSLLLFATDLRDLLLRGDRERHPRLTAIVRTLPDLRDLARPLVTHVLPDGTLADDASAELDRIRRARSRTGERLRRRLESFVHDPGSGAVVQDDFVTQRNGRYVIPIRSDAPRQVRGIVHGSSSSGATLFVEPLESVEINNELVRLAEQEAAEVDRVVRGWSERCRGRLPDVDACVGALVRVDAIQAKALWAERERGIRPRIAEGASLRLDGLRHPLLDRRLREGGAEGCVPIGLSMVDGCHILVLSGPNAGGKTVALKALGLAVVLAHCGIPVPATEASVPRLEQIRADIGDHQSIEADLSTFSAHLRNVRQWLGGIRRPALFLFDEIGTGTEPGEGAALAQAVMERLRDLNVLVVATTHQAPLKAWGMTGRGACSAALEFDEVELRPTFRVLPAVAGTSAGIEVAARLGLSDALVRRAREILGTEGGQAEALLGRLRRRTSELEERTAEFSRAEASLAEERARIEERARLDRDRLREETSRTLQALTAEFREEAAKVLAAVDDRRLRAKLQRDADRADSRLRSRAAQRAASLAPTPPKGAGRPDGFLPKEGDRVRVLSLDREAVVSSVRGERIEVALGNVGITVRAEDLIPAEGPSPPHPVPRPPVPVDVPADDRSGPGAELHLLGRTVDEALPELDRYLDRASREGWPEVRIIHGHGTGRLRSAIRRHLRGHPQAASFRPGGPGEGGDGATVVQLR